MNRFPSKTNALKFIRQAGLPVETIIDVGVCTETKELRVVYPDRKHLLFEPVAEWHKDIAYNYRDVPHTLVSAAVSNTEGEGLLALDHAGGLEKITHARLTAAFVPGLRKTTTVTIDGFLRSQPEPSPYLLKVDVDGHELKILEGARNTLKNTSCVIVEILADNWLERSALLDKAGFYLADIVDLCYYNGAMAQADFVFIAKRYRNIFTKGGDAFDWDQWSNLSKLEDRIDWPKP